MTSSEPHASARAASAEEAHTAHHFRSFDQQRHASRFGMWLFLGNEVVLFGGLLVAYALYRSVFPQAFHDASRHLDLSLGTVNTVILITSSLTVALAIHFSHHERRAATLLSLGLTILFAFVFLGIKGVEYSHKFAEGALPGRYYHFEEVRAGGASMFFTLYFFLTGLHAIHVIIGIAILGWMEVKTWRREFVGGYNLPLELSGLYWHLVDLVWIFLFPLLYLI